MAQFEQPFNADEVPEDDRNFDPLPAGEYTMQVIESKIEDTKTGSGQMLVLTIEVINGPHTNRRIWDRLNIVNQNADAQRIAQRALADLCLAIGVSSVRDTEELHFKPFVGRVGIRTDKTGQYGPQNTVRYKTKGGAAPSAPNTATTRTQNGAAPSAAATKPTGNRPWANKPAA